MTDPDPKATTSPNDQINNPPVGGSTTSMPAGSDPVTPPSPLPPIDTSLPASLPSLSEAVSPTVEVTPPQVATQSSEPVAIPENLHESLEDKLGYETDAPESPATNPPAPAATNLPESGGKGLGKVFKTALVAGVVAIFVGVMGGGLWFGLRQTSDKLASTDPRAEANQCDEGFSHKYRECCGGTGKSRAVTRTCVNGEFSWDAGACDTSDPACPNDGVDTECPPGQVWAKGKCNDITGCTPNCKNKSCGANDGCDGVCTEWCSSQEEAQEKSNEGPKDKGKGGGSGGGGSGSGSGSGSQDQTGGTTTACASDSQCPSGHSCKRGSCGKPMPAGSVTCPDGYTNLPGQIDWCILGVPEVVETAVKEGSACPVDGMRSACGDSTCASDAQGGDIRKFQAICRGGTWQCAATDACAPNVTENSSCSGVPPYSKGEPSHGAFVGCQGTKNCFCDWPQDGNYQPNDPLLGKVRCYDDPGNDSCGAKPRPKEPNKPDKPSAPEDEDTPPGLPPAPPEPSVKPPAGLVCTGLKSSIADPDIGDTLTLTCSSKGSNKVDHFEFRYRVGSGGWIILDSGTAQGSNKKYSGTSQLTVSQSGSHQVQCRVCKKPNGNCTNWGKKS